MLLDVLNIRVSPRCDAKVAGKLFKILEFPQETPWAESIKRRCLSKGRMLSISMDLPEESILRRRLSIYIYPRVKNIVAFGGGLDKRVLRLRAAGC